MAMPLMCERDPQDGAFDDMFNQMRRCVRKVIECHGSEDDDYNWTFVIWLDGEDAAVERLKFNAREAGATTVELAPNLYAWCEDANSGN